jgi:hypothetical protein
LGEDEPEPKQPEPKPEPTHPDTLYSAARALT